MVNALTPLEDLPRQTATQVKNGWGEVVRQVQQQGSVAITNHSNIEMVLIDGQVYQQLASEMAALRAREQAGLDELTRRFNARLAVLQQPDAGSRVDQVFASEGKLAPKPKAGASF